MKSLSNVIKNSCILYDRAPVAISLQGDGGVRLQQSAEDVGQIISNNALESADISLKHAVVKAEEISNRSRIEAQLHFIKALKEGRLKGRQDGLSKGRSDGSISAAENVGGAAREFVAHVSELNMQYSKQLSEAKADCADFAFGLAEDILGIQIDRESDDCAELLDTFLAEKPSKATLDVDGCSYQFETFLPDALISSADGLQGISVSAETEEYDQTAKSQQANECEQIDADLQTPAGGQKAAVEQRLEAEDVLADKVDAGQDGQDKSRPAQPQAEEADPPQMPDEIGGADDADEPQASDSENPADHEDIIDSEKFVFVRPARKSINIKADKDSPLEHEITFGDIAHIGQDKLKAVLRKAPVNDIAAALSGADETVSEALMNAMSRRAKENVLDVMKYLGPVSQADTDAARNKLAEISAEIIKAGEGGEADV